MTVQMRALTYSFVACLAGCGQAHKSLSPREPMIPVARAHVLLGMLVPPKSMAGDGRGDP
jgi:hypothetical protein